MFPFIYLIVGTSLGLLANSVCAFEIDVNEVFMEPIIADVLHRETREVLGSGEPIVCPNSDAQTCELSGSTCTCHCKPNYYESSPSDGTACVLGKVFSGKARFTDELANTTRKNVESALNVMFNDTLFEKAVVVELLNGSTIATYTLYFRNDLRVNKDYVMSVFTGNNNCSGPNQTTVVGMTLDVTSTCTTAVLPASTLCETVFSDYCDSITTTCSANDNGYVTCPCNVNYFAGNTTTCLQQLCTEDADCNSPFGKCTSNADINTCQCMWGFSGTYCYDPWLFTFTIVVAGGGLILVIVIVVLAIQCSKNRKAKDKTSYSYEADDANIKFNDFQPGAMRARAPTNPYVTEVYNGDSGTSMKEELPSKTISTNGHSNPNFNHSPQVSTSTFGSPKKSRNEREASDYF